MWFVPNWSSKPCSVRASGHAITPALLSSTWISGWRARTASAKRRTLGSDPSSSASTAALPPALRIASATPSAFARSRAPITTCAPRLPRTRALSAPRPPEPPVTTATLPARSMPAATSAAVDSKPNRDGSSCCTGLSSGGSRSLSEVGRARATLRGARGVDGLADLSRRRALLARDARVPRPDSARACRACGS